MWMTAHHIFYRAATTEANNDYQNDVPSTSTANLDRKIPPDRKIPRIAPSKTKKFSSNITKGHLLFKGIYFGIYKKK